MSDMWSQLAEFIEIIKFPLSLHFVFFEKKIHILATIQFSIHSSGMRNSIAVSPIVPSFLYNQ